VDATEYPSGEASYKPPDLFIRGVLTAFAQRAASATANCELRIVLTEPGLYRLIFKSRKPVAKRFQRWVLHEVLPSIRKTGKYEIPQPQNILLLPPTDIRLVNFVNALSVIGINATNPRINQAVQDLVTNQIFGIQPQLSAQTERWLSRSRDS
jgi:BRO family, N-terminal domain